MGIFDEIEGKAQDFFGRSGTEKPGLVKGITEMLSDRQHGGISGLIESFRQKGLGEIISSWIGTGANKEISPEQVKQGLGNERLQTVADHAGVSTDEAANQLSEHLPNVIDKLTPEGNVPEQGTLEKGLAFLKSKLS